MQTSSSNCQSHHIRASARVAVQQCLAQGSEAGRAGRQDRERMHGGVDAAGK